MYKRQYLDGQSVIRDFEKGAELVCKAADMGEQNAQFNCGAMLSDGKGVAKDRTKALEYWQLASHKGQIAASNLLTQAYKTGDGIDADPAQAFDMFSMTAEQVNDIAVSYSHLDVYKRQQHYCSASSRRTSHSNRLPN